MIDSVLRKALEARLSAEGLAWVKLRHLELRSADKSLYVEVDLEGELEPVHATASYRLAYDGVVIEEVVTSRAWLTACARLALEKHGGHFPLPSGLAGTVARVLL